MPDTMTWSTRSIRYTTMPASQIGVACTVAKVCALYSQLPVTIAVHCVAGHPSSMELALH